MEYIIAKKLVKLTTKDGKENTFLNFYLYQKEFDKLIPIEVVAFKDKDGKVKPSSKFDWNFVKESAVWLDKIRENTNN